MEGVNRGFHENIAGMTAAVMIWITVLKFGPPGRANDILE